MIRKVIIILFCVSTILTGCQSHKTESTISEITLKEFEDKIQNNTSFIVIIGREDCPNCVALKKMIKKKKIKTEQLYYLPYTQSNKDEFINQIEQYVGTMEKIPYYAKVKNGTVVKTGQGYSDDTEFIRFLDN